eukprot:7600159-Alexandrium_andersonii.AAC.1
MPDDSPGYRYGAKPGDLTRVDFVLGYVGLASEAQVLGPPPQLKDHQQVPEGSPSLIGEAAELRGSPAIAALGLSRASLGSLPQGLRAGVSPEILRVAPQVLEKPLGLKELQIKLFFEAVAT